MFAMSSPTPGAVCPVFLGGPFDGEDVPADVVASGQSYQAVQHVNSLGRGLFAGLFDPPEFRYVTYQPQKYRMDPMRGCWLEVKVWVDTRLCTRGRTTLMLRLISERGWLDHPHPHGGTPDAQERAQEQGNPVDEPVSEAPMQAQREVEDAGRGERGD